jgi:hypothetical protein
MLRYPHNSVACDLNQYMGCREVGCYHPKPPNPTFATFTFCFRCQRSTEGTACWTKNHTRVDEPPANSAYRCGTSRCRRLRPFLGGPEEDSHMGYCTACGKWTHILDANTGLPIPPEYMATSEHRVVEEGPSSSISSSGNDLSYIFNSPPNDYYPQSQGIPPYSLSEVANIPSQQTGESSTSQK